MNHKYKRCAWHDKPKKRINETLGKAIAKKYNGNYVKPTPLNKIRYGLSRKINIAAHNAFKPFEVFVNKLKVAAAESFKNMDLKLENRLPGRTNNES